MKNLIFSIISLAFYAQLNAQFLVNTKEQLTNNSAVNTDHILHQYSQDDALYVLSNKWNGLRSDVLLVKYNSSGEKLWEKTFDHALSNDYAIDLAIDSQGDIIILALCSDSISEDIMLLKCDDSGTQIWKSIYAGSHLLNDFPTDLFVDGDTLYVSGSVSDSIQNLNILLAKFDPSGTLEWDVLIDETELNDFGGQLTMNLQKHIFLSCFNEWSQTNGMFRVIEFDKQGNQISEWVDSTGVNGFDEPLFIKNSGSDILVTGSRSGKLYLVSLDSLLDTNWTYSYQQALVGSKAIHITTDSAQNIYLAGSASNAFGGTQPLVLKISDSGTLIWDRVLGVAQPDTLNFAKAVLIQDTSVNVLLSTFNQDYDVTMLQMDSSGNMLWQKTWDKTEEQIPLSFLNSDNLQAFCLHKSSIGIEEYLLDFEFIALERNYHSDTSGQALWVDNEIMISVSPAFVKKEKLENQNIEYGSLSTFLSDSAIAIIGAYSNESIAHTDSMTIRRSVPFISVGDSISHSRSGKRIRMYEYWRDFVIQLPEGSNEEAFIAFLDSMRPAVQYGSLNYMGEWASFANDSIYSDSLQTNLRSNNTYPNAHSHVEEAWNIETGNENIRVGVLDNGIYYQHQDFGDGTLSGSVVEDGYDFVRNHGINRSDYDGGVHGTPVAGIIGAIRNNQIGIAGVAGGDASLNKKGVRLFDCKIGEGAPELNAFKNGVILSLKSEGSIAFDVDMLNFSGEFKNESIELRKVLRDIAQHEVLFVQSHGNEGILKDVYPSSYSDDLSILVSSSGSDGKRATDSTNCTGPLGNYSEKLDILAAGCTENVYSLKQYHKYGASSGTSVAAPLVSGVAALMQSQLYGKSTHYPYLSPEDLEQIIQRSATALAPFPPTTFTGWGRLHADSALRIIQYPRYRARHFNPNTHHSFFDYGINVLRVFLPHKLIQDGDTLPSGIYYARIRTIRKSYQHSIPLGDTLIDAWARSGVSEGLMDEPNAFSSGFTFDLIDLPGSEMLQYSETSATLESIGFLISFDKDSVALPKNFEYPKKFVDIHMPYTLYLRNAIFNDSIHTAINAEKKLLDVGIYPNPGTGIFHLQMTPEETIEQISIRNIEGRLIQSLEHDFQTETGLYEIDLSAQQNGMYFISIKTAEKQATEKLILMR